MPRRIVACGGEQLQYPTLTRYLLEFTGKARPKILFLPTASGDDSAYLLTLLSGARRRRVRAVAPSALQPDHR